MRWVVLIAPLDVTDAVERVEITDDEAHLYAGEAGVLIQTGPDRLGGYANERIVPWSRVLDYQKIGAEPPVEVVPPGYGLRP